MNFFKTLILLTLFFLTIQNSFADSHDKKNLVDQAKDLTNEAQKVQAKKDQDIKDATEEEEVPLNDPFAGNAATSSGNLIAFDSDTENQENYQSASEKKSVPKKKKATYQTLVKKPIYSIHSYSKWAK